MHISSQRAKKEKPQPSESLGASIPWLGCAWAPVHFQNTEALHRQPLSCVLTPFLHEHHPTLQMEKLRVGEGRPVAGPKSRAHVSGSGRLKHFPTSSALEARLRKRSGRARGNFHLLIPSRSC